MHKCFNNSRPYDTRFQCTGMGKLPAPVLESTGRPLFTPEKQLGYQVV